MDNPYDFLGQYEDMFERDIENREKAWEEADDYGVNEYGPLDMVEDSMPHSPVYYGPDEHTEENINFQESMHIERENDAFSPPRDMNIPGPPPHGERFAMRSSPTEAPPGLLDRPDRRDAPYNPYQYRSPGGPGTPRSTYRSPPLFSSSLGQIKRHFGRMINEIVAFYTPCPKHRRLVSNNVCEKCEYQNFERWRKNPGKEKFCSHPEYDEYFHDYYFGGLDSSEEDKEEE